MPKVYGSYKTGADIYKDPKSKKFYILEWNPQTSETYKKFGSFKPSANNNKTIKSSRPGKTRTRKQRKNRNKQLGGRSDVLGEMQQGDCRAQVLNTPSYKGIQQNFSYRNP